MIRFPGIDPATRTGFCVIDMQGRVLVEKELTGTSGGPKEYQIASLLFEVKEHLRPDDICGVENFALTAKDINKVTSGNNWAARMACAMATREKRVYASPEPGQVKKFLGVEEWTGTYKVKGDPTTGRKRKDGKVVKQECQRAAEELFNYPHTISDNTSDALTIAHITRLVYMQKNGLIDMTTLPINQYEVIFQLTDKDGYEKYEKAKGKKRGKPKSKRKPKNDDQTEVHAAPALF